MAIETLKSPNPRNRNGISVIKSKFLSVSSMNTLLAILKVTDARRDVILAGGLYQGFPWRHLPRPLCEVFNIVSTSRIFEVEKGKIGEIMDGAVPANARQQIKANVSVSILG